MKALSVRAPWWWAILHGKPVENRDWYTNQRGRIALHASKWWKWEELKDDWLEILRMAEGDGITLPRVDKNATAAMKAAGGCIVGTVEIVACVTAHPSKFFVGKFGFVLRDPVMIATPIPFKGALGFFDVPDDILPEGIRKGSKA
jgi:hypothetical protein